VLLLSSASVLIGFFGARFVWGDDGVSLRACILYFRGGERRFPFVRVFLVFLCRVEGKASRGFVRGTGETVCVLFLFLLLLCFFFVASCTRGVKCSSLVFDRVGTGGVRWKALPLDFSFTPRAIGNAD